MAKKKATTSTETSAAFIRPAGADTGGLIYFLGFIGAAVHYVKYADSFWSGVLGILKALVWPALLVYRLLGL